MKRSRAASLSGLVLRNHARYHLEDVPDLRRPQYGAPYEVACPYRPPSQGCEHLLVEIAAIQSPGAASASRSLKSFSAAPRSLLGEELINVAGNSLQIVIEVSRLGDLIAASPRLRRAACKHINSSTKKNARHGIRRSSTFVTSV